MSTRAFVGIINHNKSCEIIFTHWDGYPSHHGPILFHSYKTTKAVRTLMKSGNHEVLGPLPFDGEPDKSGSTKYKSIEEMFKDTKNSWVEYVYLFDTKHSRWLLSKHSEIKFKSLSMKDCER